MLLNSPYQFGLESGRGGGHYTDKESARWRRGKVSIFRWEVLDVFCVCAEEVLDILGCEVGHFSLWFGFDLFYFGLGLFSLGLMYGWADGWIDEWFLNRPRLNCKV